MNFLRIVFGWFQGGIPAPPHPVLFVVEERPGLFVVEDRAGLFVVEDRRGTFEARD